MAAAVGEGGEMVAMVEGNEGDEGNMGNEKAPRPTPSYHCT